MRREIHKLALARLLGRIDKPSRLRSLFKLWLDMDPVTKAITGIIGLLTAIVSFSAAVMKFKK